MGRPFAFPHPRLAAPVGFVGSGASANLCVDRREPSTAFARLPPRVDPLLCEDPDAPRAVAPGGSTTRAAALELLRRPPAAAADLGVAVADLGVSVRFAEAAGFSLRCRLPPPDTDAGVCSPSAARFRVRIRSVGKNVLHSFGLSRLCGGVNEGFGQDPRGRTGSSKRVESRRGARVMPVSGFGPGQHAGRRKEIAYPSGFSSRSMCSKGSLNAVSRRWHSSRKRWRRRVTNERSACEKKIACVFSRVFFARRYERGAPSAVASSSRRDLKHTTFV